MPDPVTLSLLGLGAGSSLFGGILGSRAQARNQSNQINNLNFLDTIGYPTIMDLVNPNVSAGREGLFPFLGNFGMNNPFINDLLAGPGGLGSFRGDILNPIIAGGGQTDFTSFLRDQITPGLGGAQNFGQGLAPGTFPSLGPGFGTAPQPGRTDLLNFLENQSRNLFLQDPRSSEAAQLGLDIIRSGGRTDDTQQAVSNFLDILEGRGQTRQTRQLFGEGMDLIRSGGFTPELSRLSRDLKAQIDAGGLTPEGKRLFESLVEIVESGGRGGALLPMEQVLAFARDAAATASIQQAESVRRQALQRGGGPGAIVSSGLQNQALAEFADQAARNEAAAVREAALGQQGLQLQQLLGASQSGAQVVDAANRLLGILNSTQGDIARAASQNLATGANLGLGSQQLANQLFGTATTGLNQTLANELTRLGIGQDIFGGSMDDILNRANLASQLGLGVGTQTNQNLSTLLGTGTDLAGIQANLLSDALGLNLESLGITGNILGNQQAAQLQAGSTLFGGGLDAFTGTFPAFLGARTNTLGPIPSSGSLGTGLLRSGLGLLGDVLPTAFPQQTATRGPARTTDFGN